MAYSKNDEDLKENLIYPLSFLVVFLTLSELWKGGGGFPKNDVIAIHDSDENRQVKSSLGGL